MDNQPRRNREAVERQPRSSGGASARPVLRAGGESQNVMETHQVVRPARASMELVSLCWLLGLAMTT